MKRIIKTMILVFLFSLAISLTSCDINSALGDLTGNSEQQEVNVLFMVDDEIYHRITIKQNEKIVIPANPTKEGYSFVGWYSDYELTKEYDFTAQLSGGTLLLYAKFDKNEDSGSSTPETVYYTVTFYVDGIIYHKQTIVENTTYSFPPTPTKEGYTFTGWYSNEDLISTPTNVKNDITLEAKFEENEPEVVVYKVTYTIDGKVYKTVEVNEKELLTEPTEPEKEGYTFIGWYIGEEEWDFETQITESITLEAKFEENEPEVVVYKVTYTIDGKVYKTVEVNEKELLTEPTEPEKEGYTFIGWYIGEEEWDFETQITESITLEAKFEENEPEIAVYQVIYRVGDEIYKVVKVNEKELLTEPNAPRKSGYRFVGWYLGKEEWDFETPITESITLEAKFEDIPLEEVELKDAYITFWHTMGYALRDVLDEVIAEFNELYPNIYIEHQQIGGFDDVYNQVIVNVRSGRYPNMAYCYNYQAALYESYGILASLDQYAYSEAYGFTGTELKYDGISEEDYIQSFINEGKVNGNLNVLPFLRATEGLYYNKTFFEEHNLTVPTTWEEMWEVCAKIKEIDPTSTPLGYDNEFNLFVSLLESYGYSVCDEYGYDINNENVQKLMKEFKGYYDKGYFTTQNLCGSYTNYFMTDVSVPSRTYMCIGSTAGATYQVNSDGAFETGVACIPGGSEGVKLASQGPSLVMFDSSTEEELATWVFMQYLNTPEVQAKFALASGYVPVNTKATELEYYQDFLSNASGDKSGIIALSHKYALEQKDNYLEMSPIFGSTVRNEIISAFVTIMSDSGTNIDTIIDNKLGDAQDKCQDYYYTYFGDINVENVLNMSIKESALNEEFVDYNKIVFINNKMTIKDVTYQIDWKCDNEYVTITENENGLNIAFDYANNKDADQHIKFVVTVTDGTETASKEVHFVLPKLNCLTIEEYDKALEGETVIYRGIVVGKEAYSAVYGNVNVYLQSEDGNAGVYVYRLYCTQEEYDNEIIVGRTLCVKGNKNTYNGLREITYAYMIKDEYSEYDMVDEDITELVLNNSNLSKYQNRYVSVNNLKILEISEKDNKGRYNIIIGDVNNKFVVRVNTNITPIDSEAYKSYDELALKIGMVITVKGVCSWNDNPQIYPLNVGDIEVSEIDYGNVIASTLIQQVSFDERLYGINEITLPSYLKGDEYSSYQVIWTSSSSNVVINDYVATTKFVKKDEDVTLTLTVKDFEGNIAATATTVIPLTNIKKAALIVENPAIGIPYDFTMFQGNTNETLYFTGKMDGNFLAASTNYSESVKVQLEEIEGGYALFFMDGDIKTYINVTQRIDKPLSGTISLSTENSTVYVWDNEYNTLVTTQGEGENQYSFYIGTYNTFRTFSVSRYGFISTSYPSHLVNIVESTDEMIIDDVISKVLNTIGTTKFNNETAFELTFEKYGASIDVKLPVDSKILAWDLESSILTVTPTDLNLTEMLSIIITSGEVSGTIEIEISAQVPPKTEIINGPIVGKEYNLAVYQENLGKTLFFTGEITGKYLAVTEDPNEAVKVQLGEIEGGYALFFVVDDVKTYINVTQRESSVTKADISLSSENTTVYTWNDEYNTLVTTQGEGDNQNTFYIGTYASYETLSTSNISYIATSFPVQFVEVC